MHKKPIEIYLCSCDDFESCLELTKFYGLSPVFLLPLAELVEKDLYSKIERSKVNFIPYISNVSKGKENEILNRNLNCAIEIAKDHGVYIGNLSWLSTFVDAGAKVFADYGLNVFNLYTKECFIKLGCDDVALSLEKSDRESEIYPLMTLQYHPRANELKSIRRERLVLKSRDFSSQVILFPERVKNIDGQLSHAEELKRIYYCIDR